MAAPSDSAPGGAAQGTPMAVRAALALLLMVGFYVLALAVVAGLLWLCYYTATHHRFQAKAPLGCFITAVGLLWSILPRIDRFTPPGPRLLPRQHPLLFKEIEGIAKATGQAMPAEVYLEGEVNAWVSQRGGIMGLGGRRVMGLGLALMRVINVSELRAVLAHEFGHFHAGDTKLGPWVYKTRAAIGRTIGNLGNSILRVVFLWYGKMFLLVTHAVSRRQEFTADQLAASVAGSTPLISGLQKIHGAAAAFEPYWRSEVAPVLSAGFRPPLADGFARFLRCSEVAAAVTSAVAKDMQAEGSVYDTHPSLPQRIAAVQGLPGGENTCDAPAISLLADVPQLEHELLASLAGATDADRLVATRWEDAGATIYVLMWRRLVADSALQQEKLRPELLPQWVEQWFQQRGRAPLSKQEQQRLAAIGAALALAAIGAGAALECELGKPAAVVRDGTRVEPFSVLQLLVEGKLSAATWLEQCEALGIKGIDLGSVAAAAV